MFSLIAALIQKTGLVGVGLLMLAENLIPILPSELIMPMAGYEAARGAFSPMLAVLVGTAASVAGGAVWYDIGRRLGLARLKRWAAQGGWWLTVTPEELDRAEGWFRRWGAAAVCIGRTLPGVRGVICLPAGVSRMAFGRFLIWSTLGALIWTTLLVLAGYALQQRFTAIDRWLNPVTDGFAALCVVFYVARVVRRVVTARRHARTGRGG